MTAANAHTPGDEEIGYVTVEAWSGACYPWRGVAWWRGWRRSTGACKSRSSAAQTGLALLARWKASEPDRTWNPKSALAQAQKGTP